MPEPESRSPLNRLKAMPGRTKLFFVVGLVLVVVFTTGDLLRRGGRRG